MFETVRGALGRFAKPGSGWVGWVAGLLMAVATTATIVAAVPRNSPTIDEPGHLVRGLAFWWTTDRAIHWPHPPAGQAVATVGAAVAGFDHRARVDVDTDDFRRATYAYARAGYADMRGELMLARYGMAVLAGLLGLGMFAWCRRRYDEATAWLGMVLYGTNTVLLAHAGLITTDFPIAAVTMLAVMAVHRHITSEQGGLAWMASSVGLLAVTKISGLMIAAILAVPVIVTAVRGQGPYAGRPPAKRLATIFVEGFTSLVVMLLCINAVYLFQLSGLSVAEILARPVPYDRFEEIEVMGESRWIGRLPDWFRVPLPWTYLYSADFVMAQGQHGHGNWFLGEKRGAGTPGYFVILLAAKLPLAILGLLLVGIVLGLWHRRASSMTKILGYFAGAFLLATFFARINIGVRHALPVVPIASVLAGRAAALCWTGAGIPERFAKVGRHLGKLIVVVACVGAVGGVAMAYPHYIADFNLAVGGRAGGHQISIIGEDWGQDFVDFARWVDEEGVEQVDYVENSKLRVMELEHLGVPVKAIGCGASRKGAVVLMHLQTFETKKSCRRWIDKHFERRAVINDHLLVFEAKPKTRRPAKR